MTEPSLPGRMPSGNGCTRSSARSAIFRRGSVSENYTEVREAELRVRSAWIILATGRGSCGPGTAGAAPLAGQWAAGEVGKVAAGGRPACGVRGDQRTDCGN